MLPNFSRFTRTQRGGERSPFSSPNSNLHASPVAVRRGSLEERRRPAAIFTQGISQGPASSVDDQDQEEENEEEEDQEDELDEDEPGEQSPLLPIFSAAHLGMSTLHPPNSLARALLTLSADALPVYNLTHTLRLLVVPRCETTLSWDQLRSPQVSQFLVKPIQQQIRTSHFSRATLYALMANCLQFNKEVSMYPGNSGASKTRALVCELLAIKLLKEYSTRELVCWCLYRQ